MKDPLDQTCYGCKFTEDQSNQCLRYIKSNNQGKEYCEWPNENDTSQTPPGCMSEVCPVHCYLTEALLQNTEYMGTGAGEYFTDNSLRSLQTNPGDPEIGDEKQEIRQRIIEDAADAANNKPELKKYRGDFSIRDYKTVYPTIGEVGTPLTNKCITFITAFPDSDSDTDGCNNASDIKAISDYLQEKVPFTCGDDIFDYEQNLTKGMSFKFPQAPDSGSLYKLFNNIPQEILQGTRWDKFNTIYEAEDNSDLQSEIEKLIPELILKESIQSNTYHESGVNIGSLPSPDNWYDINDVTPILKSYLTHNNLPSTPTILQRIYNDTTKKFIDLLKENTTNFDDTVINYENKISDNQITEWANRQQVLSGITGQTAIEVRPTKLIDIFMITRDDGTNIDLENRLNELMNTGERNDDEFVKRIGSYQTIHELGKNPRDIRYIEDKIKKFLGVDTDLFVDVFLQSNVPYEEICKNGFSSRPMEILGRIIQLDTTIHNTEEYFEEKLVIRKVLKYVPSIMKKIIDIAEKYENAKCDRITKKTLLYKEIYKDLFIDSNVLKFELPDLGIFTFFEDFTRNIYTKILLLIFFGFIITQIVSLFKVNLNMST